MFFGWLGKRGHNRSVSEKFLGYILRMVGRWYVMVVTRVSLNSLDHLLHGAFLLENFSSKTVNEVIGTQKHDKIPIAIECVISCKI